jgi:flagellar biosynthesis protein FlhB
MIRRIDPAAGLARIFSWRTVTACLGGAAGLAVVMAAAAVAIRPLLALTATLPEAAVLAGMSWRSAAWLFVAAATVAASRWLLARRRFERQIRMTPEEFADETKSSQADPKIKLLQRQRPRQPAAGAA